MNRRGFLGSVLALAAAPAIVRADSLMRVIPVNTSIITPCLMAWGGQDDCLPNAQHSYLYDAWSLEPKKQRFLANIDGIYTLDITADAPVWTRIA